MIAVIFEVEPAEGETQTYLDIAADLRPLLDKVDGFISVERFQSLTTPENTCRCPSGGMRRRWLNGAP